MNSGGTSGGDCGGDRDVLLQAPVVQVMLPREDFQGGGGGNAIVFGEEQLLLLTAHQLSLDSGPIIIDRARDHYETLQRIDGENPASGWALLRVRNAPSSLPKPAQQWPIDFTSELPIGSKVWIVGHRPGSTRNLDAFFTEKQAIPARVAAPPLGDDDPQLAAFVLIEPCDRSALRPEDMNGWSGSAVYRWPAHSAMPVLVGIFSGSKLYRDDRGKLIGSICLIQRPRPPPELSPRNADEIRAGGGRRKRARSACLESSRVR